MKEDYEELMMMLQAETVQGSDADPSKMSELFHTFFLQMKVFLAKSSKAEVKTAKKYIQNIQSALEKGISARSKEIGIDEFALADSQMPLHTLTIDQAYHLAEAVKELKVLGVMLSDSGKQRSPMKKNDVKKRMKKSNWPKA